MIDLIISPQHLNVSATTNPSFIEQKWIVYLKIDFWIIKTKKKLESIWYVWALKCFVNMIQCKHWHRKFALPTDAQHVLVSCWWNCVVARVNIQNCIHVFNEVRMFYKQKLHFKANDGSNANEILPSKNRLYNYVSELLIEKRNECENESEFSVVVTERVTST